MSRRGEVERLVIDGREVFITNPGKLYFRDAGITKLDVVQYFLAVAPGALIGIRDRPLVLKRFVDGAEGPPFYQKRAPANRPPWMRTVTLRFPSGRTADELVVDDAAGLAWVVNTGNMELHPHAVVTGDLDHPNELRIDLDPNPGVGWDQVRQVAFEVRAFLEELGMVGWVKTSGSRGMHINVRIAQRWGFQEVRRAALALAREIERRVPALATSKWWKEERHGVFIDYNQNAKDRTTAAAYSVRPLPDARVSAPLDWSEVADADPADFTLRTIPARFRARGDPHEKMDEAVCSLDALLERARRDEAEGLGDAPWPPMYIKQEGEPPRAAPSRRRNPVPRTRMPLIVVANAQDRANALAGLERWKARHPEAAKHLAVDDVLIDSMRGRAYTWTRIRVNLRHVPEALRPPPEPPDPDEPITR
ncbi:MAG: non-homologous end-joining DNA ligase [Myxococcaceae bacterium]|nr:non-homologous end-joining DNA ligase [Myxococcaceae bacterium]